MKSLLLLFLLFCMVSFSAKFFSPKGRTFQMYRSDALNQTFLKFSDTGFAVVTYIDSNQILTKQTPDGRWQRVRDTVVSTGGKWQQVRDTIYLIYADRIDTARMIIGDAFSGAILYINNNHQYFETGMKVPINGRRYRLF